MKNKLRLGSLTLMAGGLLLGLSACGDSYNDDIDLNQVLDVTVETIYAFDEKTQGQSPDENDPDAGFLAFSDELESNYNASLPVIYQEPISVQPMADASLIAYVEKSGNDEYDSATDDALYMIEIDGENSRVIATSRSGAVNDHRFSGTGLLAGYLIGSMLSRQRAAGVNPKSLSSKKTQTAKQAARSRAGSGSHSRGK